MEWKETDRELIAPCRIFDLCRIRRRSPEGKEESFYLLDAPNWVTVIPFTGTREELQEGKGSFLMNNTNYVIIPQNLNLLDGFFVKTMGSGVLTICG
jgi:hypothetical protein